MNSTNRSLRRTFAPLDQSTGDLYDGWLAFQETLVAHGESYSSRLAGEQKSRTDHPSFAVIGK